MGKRGPQPKPKTIKDLEGNPGKRKINRSSPVAKGGPSCPTYLTGYALTVWRRIVNSMPPKLYNACDSQLLAAYCCAADMHKKAVESIREEGEIAHGGKGAPYQNPYVSIMNKQAQLMATIGSRLGLDPAARSSLQVPEEKPKSKFADLVPIKGGQSEK